MSPSARRILIPIFVGLIALGVVLVVFVGPTRSPRPAPAAQSDAETGAGASEQAAAAGTHDVPAPVKETEAPGTETGTANADEPDAPLGTLIAVAPPGGRTGHEVAVEPLGSLDATVARSQLEFSRAGAGISRIAFSNIWETAPARRQAEERLLAAEKGETPLPASPDETQRYVLQESHVLSNAARGDGFLVPALAAIQIEVDDQRVNLFDYNRAEDGSTQYIWSEIDGAPNQRRFETRVVDEAGTPVLRIERSFTLDGFDVTLEQRIENLTDRPLDVRWSQYGPGGLTVDRSRYMDRRRYRFGYLPDAATFPDLVLAEDNDLLLERTDILKRWKKAEEAAVEGNRPEQQEYLTLWPNATSEANGYELSWFGATNRYFGFAVHPRMDAQNPGSRSLTRVVDRIMHEVSNPDPLAEGSDHLLVFTYLVSPVHTIAAGDTLTLDLGVFAGPLDRKILGSEPPYPSLSMQRLILYQMSSFCAICTFQWLAHILLGFLTLLHDYVVFDWGLAIIGLVVVVRALLHPITKRSQINMQRFGKQMGAMKPELDKLQKKHGHDPKRMQQEQMRLMREHGINPLQMLGCLPMFLQTPIWIALYAMLYFAYDIRQEPAFFGIFQKLTGGAWPFLADLSSGDHFFGMVEEPFKFFMWNVTGFNLLPVLMGVIFFIQQKYMSPPPSPTMTDDQLRQQKIMKVMMVVMFPLMLYSAPSGLTLYILTSSCIGILESRYVRAHVNEMDLNPPKKKPRVAGKPKDAQGRAFAAALERSKEKRREKLRGPTTKYKKRK